MKNKVLFSIHPTHSRVVPSSLELGDGAGTSITNLWSVSPSELPFTTNGFGNYSSNGGYPAYLRSGAGTSNPVYARQLHSTGVFNPIVYNTSHSLALRPAVHITPVHNLNKPTNLIFTAKLGFVRKIT